MASFPPPAPIITPTFLDILRAQPHLPPHAWYIVAATTASTLSRPNEVATVFTHAIHTGAGPVPSKPSESEQLLIARKLREALIKAVIVAGMPKVESPNVKQARQVLAGLTGNIDNHLNICTETTHTTSSA
jgi:hypothetical protein